MLPWAIGNFTQAQRIADGQRVQALHGRPEAFVRRYGPAIAGLGMTYHWSIDQAEYSTDIIFSKQADPQAIYDRLTRTAFIPSSQTTRPPSWVASSTATTQDELGNRFDTRIEGTRIKHTYGTRLAQDVRQTRFHSANRDDG